MISHRVRHGQFYTPQAVTDFMVKISSKTPGKARVLEPGHGEGAFLEALLTAGYTDIIAYDIDLYNHQLAAKAYPTITLEHRNYLTTNKTELFDLIIGNPPYVKWNNIEPQTKELLQESFWQPLRNGEWDLLYAFIVWSIEKLKENGELIFIVPYNWFTSTYAASLRNYMVSEGNFELLLHFSEYKLFEDCAPNALIFKYQKGVPSHHYIKVAEFEGRKASLSHLLAEAEQGLAELDFSAPCEKAIGDWRFFTTAHFALNKPWYLATPSEEQEVSALESHPQVDKLSAYCDVGVGVVSGYDQAFLVSDNMIADLPASEKKLLTEMVKAKDCLRYQKTSTTSFIFTADIADEVTLRTDYPVIYHHLLQYKKNLEARYNHHHWWQWATIRNLQLFENNKNKIKLFVPCIDRAKKTRFSFNDQAVFGAGDVLCVAGKETLCENMFYVLGWLNSSLINNWYRIKGSRSGHRTRYTQAYVSQIPYRHINFNNQAETEAHNKIVDLVKELQATEDTERKIRLENQIDEVIASLV